MIGQDISLIMGGSHFRLAREEGEGQEETPAETQQQYDTDEVVPDDGGGSGVPDSVPRDPSAPEGPGTDTGPTTEADPSKEETADPQTAGSNP